MHRYWLYIHLFVLRQNESPCVHIPPVSPLVFHEITHKLSERYFESTLNKLGYAADLSNGLLQVLLARAFHCVESFRHFGVYHEFADFVDLLSRSVCIVRTEDPALVVTIPSPTASQHRGLHTMAFDEALNDADLAAVAEDRRQDCFDLCRRDNLDIVATDPSVAILSLNIERLTFLSTATSSFSRAPSVSLLVMV